MKRSLIVIGTLGLVLSACAFQSGTKISEPPEGAFGAKSTIPLDGQKDVRGQLADVKDGMVVVQTRQGRLQLHTDGDTLVFSDGQVGSLADLREGEQVRASVRTDGGKDVALWIETPRAKKVPAAAEPAGKELAGPAGKETK